MQEEYVKGMPYFTSKNKAEKQYPYLSKDENCDVVIIGGGVTGAILGYYFAKNNINTIIVEKNRIGYGSTSITTALLQYELDSNYQELKDTLSKEEIVLAYKLGLEALEEVNKFIKENGNRCNYKKRDCLLYTNKELEFQELREEFLFRRENGFNVEFVNKENNPFPFDLKAGVYSKEGGAELDPYMFTQHLLEVGTSYGLKIYENTEAKDIICKAEGVEIITNYNFKVCGKKVILATGYNKNNLTTKKFGVLTNTFNIVTKPISNIEVWKNGTLIRDNMDPYHYFRTTEDGRIIAGGEDIDFYNSIKDESLCEEKYVLLSNKLKEMFPEFNIETEYKYCGAFIATKDNLGCIGEDKENKNKLYCLGYGANGILFAILGAKILLSTYENKKKEYSDLFSVERNL